ncbi:hypothetical protein [Streptomyces sp. OE57]|uniref:hypothetical protein n=1 Tax=Streptomyces lacaronensis TaxID=3379885 RepID=UPI0039B75BD2
MAQVAAVRAVATERRTRDMADAALVAAECPGSPPPRGPWSRRVSAGTSEEVAGAVLGLVLSKRPDPLMYGEPVHRGEILPWNRGTPPEAQDRFPTL